MSDDPATRARIATLKFGGRPLVVLDVDEVVLEFVTPFSRYLDRQGYRLLTETFRLHGNVVRRTNDEPADRETVSNLLDSFFAAQDEWQTPAEGAVAAVARLAENADVVLLSAMPHRHFAVREKLLGRHGVTAPLVPTEAAKGPAIAAMRRKGVPVAFVDDLPTNLASAREAVEDIHLVHLMAHPGFRALLQPLPEGVHSADDWAQAVRIIETALELQTESER